MLKGKRSALVLIGAMLVSFCCPAQNDGKFVEVVVSDTVRVMPGQFVYEVSIGNSKSSYSYYDEPKKDDESTLSYEALLRMINKANFKVRDADMDYKISKTGGKKGILVVVNSKQELERLYNLLKDEPGISGKIINILGDKNG